MKINCSLAIKVNVFFLPSTQLRMKIILVLVLSLVQLGASAPAQDNSPAAAAVVPVGTIIAWNTDNGQDIDNIPQGWEFCAGQLIQGE